MESQTAQHVCEFVQTSWNLMLSMYSTTVIFQEHLGITLETNCSGPHFR